MNMTKPKLKQPKLPKYAGGTSNPYDTFAAQLSPLLYRQLLQTNVADVDRAHDYMMRQLAWESDYGRSKVAREQHNYGGYGWNGRTYTTFKSDEDFIKAYVDLMTSRYINAVNAPTIQGYGRALKQKGYYEDTEEHYTNNLAGMRSISRATALHKKNNPDLYKLSNPTTNTYQATQFQPQRLNIPVNNEYNPQPHYGVSPYIDLNTAPTPSVTQTWEQIHQNRPQMFIPDISKGKQLRQQLNNQLYNTLQ